MDDVSSRVWPESEDDLIASVVSNTCEECGGSGVVYNSYSFPKPDICPSCGGSGVVKEEARKCQKQ